MFRFEKLVPRSSHSPIGRQTSGCWKLKVLVIGPEKTKGIKGRGEG